MSNQESPGGVSRRALLKSTALGSLALAAGGLTLPFTLRRAAAAVQQATGDTTRIVWGAWHDANMTGDRIDHGACMNTLTTHRPSPLAKGNPQHTNLVDIEKV
ncbi:hypothetical protein [Klebsiella pneumoniae]|uniref:hypothetical protein n=1 Tax=Klebsiella pneumoniae TaxID=573 RepID=UPI002F969D81